MQTRHTALSSLILAIGATVLSASALADTGARSQAAEARAQYQRERAVCLTGKSNQDRATCLTEAGAALNQARHEGWSDSTSKQMRDETKRCNLLPDDERKDCLARMQGQGSVSGSVAEGGILRELTTVEVGTPVVPSTDAAMPTTPK